MAQRRLIDLVNKLTKNGELDILYSSGCLVPKTIIYRDMYLKFDAYQRQGFTKKESRQKVASFFQCADERTVYTACALMRSAV